VRTRAGQGGEYESKEGERKWNRRDAIGGVAALGIAAAWLTPQVLQTKEKNQWVVDEPDVADGEEWTDWIRRKQTEILVEEERVLHTIQEQEQQKTWEKKQKDLLLTGLGAVGASLLAKEWTESLPKPVQAIPLDQEGETAGKGIQMVAGAAKLPHPGKVDAGGEDAFFVSTARQGAAGVADGVGGWSNNGVDSGEYARTLMQLCMQCFEAEGMDDPYEILRTAHARMDLPGSATACIMTMRDGEILAANVGDSSFRILRDGKVVYSSPLLLHAFNCPYQLASKKHVPSADPVSKADRFSFRPQDQDIIVLATDGVFDNLFDEQLVDIVDGFDLEDSASSASACASRIVSQARDLSTRPGYLSPFALQAREAGLVPLEAVQTADAPQLAGKLDDATCVVAVVTTAPGRFGVGSVI